MPSSVFQCIGALDGHILDVQKDYADLLGTTPGELTARHPLEITHPHDRARNAMLLDRLAVHGEAFELTKRYCRPDGSLVWVRNHVSAFDDGIGGRRLLATCRPLGPGDADPQARWQLVCIAGRLFRAGREALGDLVVGSVGAELLVLLYRIEAEGRQASVRTLGRELAYPPATVRRWLQALVDIDCVELEGGAQLDDRDAPVLLSRHGFATIEALMATPLTTI